MMMMVYVLSMEVCWLAGVLGRTRTFGWQHEAGIMHLINDNTCTLQSTYMFDRPDPKI